MKWYRLVPCGSSRERVAPTHTVKFTDLDKVIVFQVPQHLADQTYAVLAEELRKHFKREDCIVVTDDIKMFKLEEVPEDQVLAEEMMR